MVSRITKTPVDPLQCLESVDFDAFSVFQRIAEDFAQTQKIAFHLFIKYLVSENGLAQTHDSNQLYKIERKQGNVIQLNSHSYNRVQYIWLGTDFLEWP